ncbi:hypothetical protein PADco_3290 [Candidatus Profftella armatura (Diaphorina cf. continua)]|uniref:Cytosol aminopeptidase domain-containing protein n=1 Tax=Candidatus Profftella armatura (Diaphorina cf. continua) TaxID=2661583 RepID=A0A7R6W028_9PROT|nr:hypothetical protein [Candidatus Profftella armatura (Diaphorina cf. continua)]BCG49749.1 hypothetical protein PADco_3290 [Candidatus Profftella armatura (Diaphorina cf. continua)]
MLIEDIYQKQLKSNFADISNMEDLSTENIIAVYFLENFTKKYIWAHLDTTGVV